MSRIVPIVQAPRPPSMDDATWQARKRQLEALLGASLEEARDDHHRGPFGLRGLLLTVGGSAILWAGLFWAARSF